MDHVSEASVANPYQKYPPPPGAYKLFTICMEVLHVKHLVGEKEMINVKNM